MEKIKIINSLAMHYHCNYSHFLKIIVSKIYGCHLFRDFRIYKDLTYPILIEGDLKMKGAKFIVRRPDLGVIIFYKVIESVVTDYVNSTDGKNNDTFVSHMSDDANLVLCGASALTSVLNGDSRFTVVSSAALGTGSVAGHNNRLYHTLDNGELTTAAVTYLTSEAGVTFLSSLEA